MSVDLTALRYVPFPRAPGAQHKRTDAFKVYYRGRRFGTVVLVLSDERGASWRWSRWFEDGRSFWQDGDFNTHHDAGVALVRTMLRETQAIRRRYAQAEATTRRLGAKAADS